MPNISKKFNLKYGQSELNLSQSEKLIGVRPKRGATDVVDKAIRRKLGGTNWRDAGLVGGFRIIAIEDSHRDADEALDQLRMDSSIEVGTHVFEVGDGFGIFVPTGDLFIEFKQGSPKEIQQKIIDQFRLVIKEARENDSFIVSVTRSSPNPIKGLA